MEYTLFTNEFGGLNTYTDPTGVGPNGAVESYGVDLTQGPLQGRFGDTAFTAASTDDVLVPGDSRTIVPYSARAVGMSERLAVALWGSRLYRSHKGFGPWADSDINCIQYTTDIEPPSITTQPTWDCLGMAPPPVKPTVAAASSGTLPVDTYKYRVTFYNALGQESPPSPESDPATTTSANKTVNLSALPLYQGTITTNSTTSATVTPAVYGNHLRVGMRIVGPKITNVAVVTSATQSGDPRNVTLSVAATGTGADSFRDAQIVGRRIYRWSITSQTYQLIHQIPNMVDTTWSDNGSLTAGRTLDTAASTQIPAFSRDVSISPGGVMTFVQFDGNIAYLSLGGTILYRPDRVIRPPDSPMASIYALGRFIFPCKRGAFSLSIEDVTGIPIISMIDADEASEGSTNVYCVDTGNEVWWNTNKGIMGTDGLSIKPVTRYTFSRDRNAAMRNCYGMYYFNEDIYLYCDRLQDRTEASLYVYNKLKGWSEAEIIPTASAGRFGAIGSHLGFGKVVYTKDPGVSTPLARVFSGSSDRKNNWSYRTGNWVGEKISQLKKFRKVSCAYKGAATIEFYIDDSFVLSKTLGSSSGITRASFWLPPGAKGRAASVRIVATNSSAEIEEIGVWVGEQRGPMP